MAEGSKDSQPTPTEESQALLDVDALSCRFEEVIRKALVEFRFSEYPPGYSDDGTSVPSINAWLHGGFRQTFSGGGTTSPW